MTEKEKVFYAYVRQASNLMRWLKSAEEEYSNLERQIEQMRVVFHGITDEFQYLIYELLDETYDEPEEETEKPCFVYYILNQEKDKVKIGISNNPLQRAKELQTASGEEIEIFHTIEFRNRDEALEAESFLHRNYSAYRRKPSKVSKSCEWFLASPILNDMMRKFGTREKVLSGIQAERKEIENATANFNIKIS